jgi:hypothetical protein
MKNEKNPFNSIDLQWFADDEGKNAIDFAEGDDIEILVEGRDEIPIDEPTEPDEYKELSRDELIKQIEENRTRVQELNQRVDSVSAITTGLDNLNKNLNYQPSRQPQQPIMQKPGESEEDFKRRYERDLIDKPWDVTNEFYMRKIAPDIQRLLLGNLNTSRKFAQLNENTKAYMKKYSEEIEAEVARCPDFEKVNNNNIYEDCAKRVAGRHIDDIVSDKVNEVLKRQQEETTKQERPSFTEQSIRPATKARRVIITAEDEAEAARRLMNIKDYVRYVKNAR